MAGSKKKKKKKYSLYPFSQAAPEGHHEKMVEANLVDFKLWWIQPITFFLCEPAVSDGQL